MVGFLSCNHRQRYLTKYMSIIKHPGRFDGGAMEQSLLNYVHHCNGTMPWQRLQPGAWNNNHPSVRDLEYGTASLHEKFWLGGVSPGEKLELKYLEDVRKMRQYYNETFEYQREYEELSKKVQNCNEDSKND